MKYTWKKVLQELFWVNFFGCLYHANGTKMHLDVAPTIFLPKLSDNSLASFWQLPHENITYRKKNTDTKSQIKEL